MMANFQDIGLQRFRRVFRKNVSLSFCFCISREQEAAIAKFQPQNYRVIVFCSRGWFSRVQFGPEDLSFHSIPMEGLPAAFMNKWNVVRASDCFELFKR